MLRLLPLLLSLLVVAACTDDGSASSSTTGSTVPGQTTTSVDGAASTSESGSPTTSAEMPPITAPDLSGVQGVSDEIKAQIEELMLDAQEVRGLPFLTTPTITALSDEEFEARIRTLLDEDSEDLPADESLYKMLGLLADEADLSTILDDLYGEQAYGYYDGEAEEVVVRGRDDRLTQVQRSTLLHEFVHALTDQHFSQSEHWRELIDAEKLDQARAYQAMFEGDASWAEVQWIRTLPQSEVGELLAEMLQIETPVLNAAPRFLRETLVFPYDSGLSFAQSLYTTAGGWDSLNDAYVSMPSLPGSTEQIITPGDYTRDLPVPVEIPDVTVPGYELQTSSVWGEEGFRVLLNQGTGTSTMAEAADGWGGDSYHQWFNGESTALLIVYRGDTAGDVDQLEDALLSYATESFPEDHFAWVEQLDGDLYFIAADDTAVGEQMRASVGLD